MADEDEEKASAGQDPGEHDAGGRAEGTERTTHEAEQATPREERVLPPTQQEEPSMGIGQITEPSAPLEPATGDAGARDSEGAMRWIVGLLRRHGIPFQVTGGLAARTYGATRELADIDLDVPEEALNRLLPDVAPYVKFGPGRYKGTQWDLSLMTLEYRGQEIDLSGATNTRIFDQTTGEWYELEIDLSRAVEREVLGMRVPVMPVEALIDYKRRLRREVDVADVEMLEGIRAREER